MQSGSCHRYAEESDALLIYDTDVGEEHNEKGSTQGGEQEDAVPEKYRCRSHTDLTVIGTLTYSQNTRIYDRGDLTDLDIVLSVLTSVDRVKVQGPAK